MNQSEGLFEGLEKEFPQVAAQELQIPLQKVKVYLNMAMSHCLEGRHIEAESALQKCFSGVASLNHYVSSVLSLSALEQSAPMKGSSWWSTQSLFNDVDRQFSVKCHSRPGLMWSCFGVGDVEKEIYVNQQLLSLIVRTVVNHGIANTNRGFIKLSYRLDGENLLVEVHDSGVGLSEGEIESILTSPGMHSSCAGSTMNSSREISAARPLLKFLNGSLSIESAKGFGTKISLRVPVKVKAVAPRPSVPGSDAMFITEEGKTVVNGYPVVSTYVHNVTDMGIKVLVVDSDLLRLRKTEDLLSESVLRRADVQSTYCVDALEAIREIEETSYDLLLIDAHMPGVDGYQLLKFISENETACNKSMKVLINFDQAQAKAESLKLQGLCDQSVSGELTADDIQNVMRKATIKAV